MAIWNLRARVAVLWLVLTLLIVGVVAWAISAEVVMGAMRDAVRKNSESSTLRLHQNFDNSDDFSIHRIHNKVGHSIKSGVSHSERALIREVDKQKSNRGLNTRQKSEDDVYSYDQRSDDNYSSEDEETDQLQEALESIGVYDKKVTTTKRPDVSVNFDLEKLRKGLTGAQVAQVIDRLMAQSKKKSGKTPDIVVVSPTAQVPTKKSKTTKTSTKLSSKSQKYPKQVKTTTTSTTSTTTTTMTTTKPPTTRTTLKPYNRSRIQSLSLKLSNSGVTTTKPKRTKLKVSTIKYRRPVTIPSTTSAPVRSTTKKIISVTKSRLRSRKTPVKPTKSVAKPVTTSTTTETPKSALLSEMEALKSKIRQKEFEFILNKVESLEKQQKRFLKHSNTNQDLQMEGSFRDNVVSKPNYEVISFRQKSPEFTPSYSKPNYEIQNNGWHPTPVHSPQAIHPPPPPPPPPPIPNEPPHQIQQHHHQPQPNVYNNPEPMNIHQMLPPPQHQYEAPPPQHQYEAPPPQHQYESPPALPQHYVEHQGIPPQFSNNPMAEQNINYNINNGHPKDNLFNGMLPIPNRAINGGEPQMVQESHPSLYRIKSRGHSVQKSEKPGVQLSFGGGPMGGGGQLKTSPMGIFKTLLLPLLPRPRMNLNGKVVFGVVLENGVGFGKKPKIVAQHFSTGHI